MSDSVRQHKSALRKSLRERRAALGADEVRAASAAVCRHVAALPAFGRARTVALYAATRNEIDCAPLDALCRAAGARVAFPRIAAATPPTLVFHFAAPHDLAAATFAVHAPLETAPVAALDAIDLFVVPGVAFDVRGHRLGYGRGYYDAALRAAPRALRVAVAHAFQLVPALPHADHDEPVDILVTPDGARETFAR